MKPLEILRRFIHRAIREKYAFALWYLPGENVIRSLVQKETEVEELKSFEDLQGKQGFVFAPFEPHANHPVLFLREGKYFKAFQSLERWGSDIGTEELQGMKMDLPSIAVNKREYIKQCNTLIGTIRSTGISKVVLSRQKIIKRRKADSHPASILLQLKEAYPEAFCYLFYSSPTGMWMGASPEILLQEKQDHYLSIALAGTRPASASGDDSAWSEKDIQEQAFVSDYISEKIQESGIQEYSMSGPLTVRAGQVEHLRTDFRIEKTTARKQLGILLQHLHPTPAVCGTPAKQALELIRQTEKHDRAYYCGFFGPLNLDESVNLYVNLRCMKIQPEAFILYAGGGILEDSVAEDEWNETELKADTLLRIIQDKNNIS